MVTTDTSTRIEFDGIGEVSVPLLAPYGAQTQRAINLYPSSHAKTLGAYPSLVKAMLLVKAASAMTNCKHSFIDKHLGESISSVCLDLIESYQPELFPVHALHGGGGISTNMNVNEVVANLVNDQCYGIPYGQYHPAHPNDHINLNHSTSDCLQSASTIAIRNELQDLRQSLAQLIKSFDYLTQVHRDSKKIARTCLQDAVMIRFSDYWMGIKGSLSDFDKEVERHLASLLALNLGGNVIGRRDDCDKEFPDGCLLVIQELTGELYYQHDNLIQCSQSFDALNSLVGCTSNLSNFLVKIAKDIRLLSSGPDTGFGEITLPEVQPGSSALPGKINPTIPEYMVQCAIQALGHCYSASLTSQHGELDYNPWGMVLTTNLIDAVASLSDGISVLANSCILGVQVNEKTATVNAEAFIPFAFELKKSIGYKKTSELLGRHGRDRWSILQDIESKSK